MPRVPTLYEHSHSRHTVQYHHSHHDSLAPYSYHQQQQQHPMHFQSPRFSPAPTYSSSYASSSSPGSSPPPSSRMMLGGPHHHHHPNATMRTAKSGDFTTPGGVYPYQKGKKVTNAQLTHLLDYFAQHDNPSPTRRIEIANQLEMSAKAVGIWFQNERANVKKGRSRAAELLAEEAMHPIVFHSAHRPRPYIVTSGAIIPHAHHHYAPSYGHTGRSDDAISVYSCDSDDDDDGSEATEDIETPLSELVMSRHLPEVRVQLAEGGDRREEQIDGEGLMVAKILVDMKFSKS